jgi:hypothetical protein
VTAGDPAATADSNVVAIAAIDAANAEDPNLLDDHGTLRPKELVHAERMTHWLGRLDPEADDAQRLAARAHHFRRWLSPRADYPDGRAGYLRWRREARARHAREVDELLEQCGVDTRVRHDAAAIIAKTGLGRDPRVQTHEDALCLVFFELQGVSTAELLGDRTPAVVAKTLAKMSDAGRRRLDDAELDPAVRSLVAAVTEAPGPPSV